MENTNVNKLNGFECFWCKSIHLDKVSDDKYKCKSCGNINYKLTDNDNVKFIMASTYIARYNYEKADRIYQELSESENTKTKVQALYGRLLSFFGVTYIKDFNGSLVVTFSNYKPEFSSITECSYYKDIINSEYKDEYINKLNELDIEYKRIKKELNKGIKYDIFICTKISLKTKDNPNLKGYTEDSIYASKIYDELTKKGLKVFYSDKVLSGIDYDAQIYSALMRSEKILVISSDREYLESPWVQSEWERWINFIKEEVKDKNSLYLFVPNNTPIELPRKLEKTQKFTDTLELVNRLAKNKKVIASNNETNNEIKRDQTDYANKLHRCEIELEYGNFKTVQDLAFELLNSNPEDARLYILLLLCELKLKKESDLENHNKPLTDYQNFNKAIRFSSEKDKKRLEEYNKKVLNKIEEIKIKQRQLHIQKEEEKKKRVKKSIKIISFITIIIAISLLFYFKLIKPEKELLDVREYIASGEYDRAIEIIDELDGYSDSENQYVIINTYKALTNGNYNESKEYIKNINGKTDIEYDFDGGNVSRNELGEIVSEKEGYHFYGWKLDSYDLINGKNSYYLSITLKPIWEETIYTISYDLDSGLCNNLPEEFSKSNTINLPTPIKEGYTFLGWFDENDNLVKTLEFKNYNLKAKWEEITYIINYDLDGGTCDNLPEEFSKTNMIDLPIPTKDGYTFIGWYDENDNLVSNLELRNYNLKAKWEETIYTISYDLDGGVCNSLPEDFSKTNMINLPTPTKIGYLFIGWFDENDNLVNILELKNYCLKAKWSKVSTYIYLGKYPQTKITDNILINKLKTINNTNELGYIEYNGNEYKEYSSNYYLVEPIKWKILEQNNNTYKLVSDVILDQSVFYKDRQNDRTINNNTIYPNNYEYSIIRAWLNGYDGTSYDAPNYTGKGFINIAFTEEEKKLINATNVDNSASTTKSETNPYTCDNTIDKVYLLSYQDVTNKYFTTEEERQAKVTDYAEAKGVFELYGYGYFWLRSPHGNYSYIAYYVNNFGNVDSSFCHISSPGARPALEITIK